MLLLPLLLCSALQQVPVCFKTCDVDSLKNRRVACAHQSRMRGKLHAGLRARTGRVLAVRAGVGNAQRLQGAACILCRHSSWRRAHSRSIVPRLLTRAAKGASRLRQQAPGTRGLGLLGGVATSKRIPGAD